MLRILLPLRLLVSVVVGLTLFIVGFGCAGSALTPRVQMNTVRQVFPAATDIAERQMDPDAETSTRSGKSVVSEVRGPVSLLGYVVETQVAGRSGPFGIAVLLDERLTVKRALVTSYPWSHGRDVGRRSFARQFEGKGPEDVIEIGKDIDAVTGATISCRAMAQGVREAVKLLTKAGVTQD